MIKPHELIGSWQLDDWTIEYDDGRTLSRPFGEGAQGVLIYAADGAMAVSIMRAGRASLSNANARKAPEAERAAAFDGYFGYAGRWRLADGEMVHEIEQALNPDFVGTAQTREIDYRGDVMVLSARQTTASGATMTNRLVWRRAGAA